MKENAQHQAEQIVTANTFIQRLQEGSRAWESEGRDAWTALRRLGGTALKAEDAEVIARRLHKELPSVKAVLKQKGITLGQFCMKAGLGQEGQYSRELHRMLLPAGKSAREFGLRRSAEKYRKLLSAMAVVTGESTSTLANRLLAGTSLHPVNSIIRNEIENVQLMLQGIVDAVDTEFKLYKTFMETAQLKAEHATDGGTCRWPHYDAAYRTGMFEPWDVDFRTLEKSSFSEDEFEKRDRALTLRIDAIAAEKHAAMDTARAYWEQPISGQKKDFMSWFISGNAGSTPSGVLQEDEFFYIPHCHLGYGDSWGESGDFSIATREMRMPKLRETVLDIYAHYGHEPEDNWNDAEKTPYGQTGSKDFCYGQWHSWIVIYPAPDNSRLMPMFYIPGEEGGAILVPLDVISLNALRYYDWVSPDGEITSFYERIKSLIGFRPGESQVIIESFRRTAPWLSYNPIIKISQQKVADQEMMMDFYTKLTKQGEQL